MKAWISRLSNFNRLNRTSYQRHEMANLQRNCSEVQEGFTKIFKEPVNGKKVFNLLLPNAHTFVAHYSSSILYLGTYQPLSLIPVRVLFSIIYQH